MIDKVTQKSSVRPSVLDDHYSKINAQYGATFSFGSCFSMEPTFPKQ